MFMHDILRLLVMHQHAGSLLLLFSGLVKVELVVQLTDSKNEGCLLADQFDFQLNLIKFQSFFKQNVKHLSVLAS